MRSNRIYREVRGNGEHRQRQGIKYIGPFHVFHRPRRTAIGPGIGSRRHVVYRNRHGFAAGFERRMLSRVALRVLRSLTEIVATVRGSFLLRSSPRRVSHVPVVCTGWKETFLRACRRRIRHFFDSMEIHVKNLLQN